MASQLTEQAHQHRLDRGGQFQKVGVVPMLENPVNENLLFGLLAFQNGLLSPEQLVAALQTWQGDRSHSLQEVMRRQEALSEEQSKDITALVQQHFDGQRIEIQQSGRVE